MGWIDGSDEIEGRSENWLDGPELGSGDGCVDGRLLGSLVMDGRSEGWSTLDGSDEVEGRTDGWIDGDRVGPVEG